MTIKVSVGACLVATLVQVDAQNSGTTAPAAAPPAVPPGLQSRQPLPPALDRGGRLPPGLQRQQQLLAPQAGPQVPQQQNPYVAASNAAVAADSNQFGFGTGLSNQVGYPDTNVSGLMSGTNALGVPATGEPNQGGLSPNGSALSTNQFYATNTFAFSNQVTIRLEDRAFTSADRGLLLEIRHRCQPLLGTGQPWAPAVHFICRDKDVTVFGYVPDQDDRRQLLALVQQTPGIGRVIDELVTDDRAFSDPDRMLLARLRSRIQPMLASSAPPPPVVRFVCHDGQVTVVGYVPGMEEKDRVLTLVEQTQGVAKVTDQLSVTGSGSRQTAGTSPEPGRREHPNGAAEGAAQAGINAGAGFSGTNAGYLRTNLAGPRFATNTFGGAAQAETNLYGAFSNQLSSAPNLSPTSRTNAPGRVYGTNPPAAPTPSGQ